MFGLKRCLISCFKQHSSTSASYGQLLLINEQRRSLPHSRFKRTFVRQSSQADEFKVGTLIHSATDVTTVCCMRRTKVIRHNCEIRYYNWHIIANSWHQSPYIIYLWILVSVDVVRQSKGMKLNCSWQHNDTISVKNEGNL